MSLYLTSTDIETQTMDIDLAFNRNQLETTFNDPLYKSEKLIQLLEKNFCHYFAQDVGVCQGYTLKQHTQLVLNQFEHYYHDTPLPGLIDKRFFRLLLALHDIGKPKAIENGDKKLQHLFTPPMVKDILKTLHFSIQEINIGLALLSQDPLGGYLKNKIDLKSAAGQIKKMAQKTELSLEIFYNLLLVYYKCDAGSYTVDAGGLPGLDHLFEFDRKNRKIEFAEPWAEKIFLLDNFCRTETT